VSKKLVLIVFVMLVLPLCACADVEINEMTFPDANFRDYVISELNNGSSMLTDAVIAETISIRVSGKIISSLQGIEYFTNLQALYCSNNLLTKLNLSNMPKLDTIYCDNNQLIELIVCNTPELEWLWCQENKLTELDVSGCPMLETLDCSQNPLTELDVSNHSQLSRMDCDSCSRLTRLNVSNNPKLTTLSAYDNMNLVELNVSNCSILQYLNCSNNQLKELDVSENPALRTLFCGSNQITELDVSKNTVLTSLECDRNQLTELDVSKNVILTNLKCYQNQLTELDISNQAFLSVLWCSGNKLTELDVSKNSDLTSLECGGNQLSELDVSKNLLLTSLACGGNRLKELSVHNNTALRELTCPNNQLTKLDVSKNTKLYWMACSTQEATVPCQYTGFRYTIDLKSIVGEKNLDKVMWIYPESYDSVTGVWSSDTLPANFFYKYDLQCSNQWKMDVLLTPVITISAPPVIENLMYDGTEHSGVKEGTGYTLTGHKGINAGSYTATATLATGYQWSDGTTEAKYIPWSIAKAEGPSAPTGLIPCVPSTHGGSDGSISGVDSNMEYADNPDFANAKTCAGDSITGLKTGIYHIRAMETNNIKAGQAVAVLLHSAEQLVLPSALTLIEEEAFSNSQVEEIILGDLIKHIGARAFADCEKLVLIYLPNDVEIAEDAFDGCEQLIILCSEGSTGHVYATEHKIPYFIMPFVSVDTE